MAKILVPYHKVFNNKNLEIAERNLLQNYILNGGEKMYNYTISNDVTNEVLAINDAQNKKKKVDDLLKQLDSINKKFSTQNSESGVGEVAPISLERKTFESKTPEQIAQVAKDSLEDFRQSSISKIEQENKQKENQLFENKTLLQDSANEQKNNIENYIKNAKQNVSDEALKRGLARSSIVINQLGAFDQKQLEEFAKIDKEISQKIDALNFEILGLNGELEKALNDFNISYAVKLSDKISDLNSKLKEQENKVIEYNNDIALQEAKFNKDLKELEEKLSSSDFEKGLNMIEIYGKYGSNVVNKFIQDNLYNATKNYLSSLSKQEAIEILKDENVKKSLGNLYEILLKEFGA